VLVMTATPIPRTLALSLYGDLDVSVLDELPPGRTPIVTRRVPGEEAEKVWEFVRKQVAQGRQAYIVYPVIEGSKDDQPELDFSHDDGGDWGRSCEGHRFPGLKIETGGTQFPTEKIGAQGENGGAVSEGRAGGQSGSEVGPEIRCRNAREAAQRAAGRPARGPAARAAGRG
jgi:hypothetical protein